MYREINDELFVLYKKGQNPVAETLVRAGEDVFIHVFEPNELESWDLDLEAIASFNGTTVDELAEALKGDGDPQFDLERRAAVGQMAGWALGFENLFGEAEAVLSETECEARYYL